MISDDSDPLILGFFMTTFPYIVIRYFLIQVVNYELFEVLGRQFQMAWLIVAIITLLLGTYGMAISRKMTRFLAYYLIFSVGVALVAMSLFDLEIWKQIEIWWFGIVVNVIVFLFVIKPFQQLDYTLDKMEYIEKDILDYINSFLGLVPMLVLPFTISFVGFFSIYKIISDFSLWAGLLMLIALIGVYIFVGRYYYKIVQYVDWKQLKLVYSEEEAENSEIILQNRWLLFAWTVYFLIQAVLGFFPRLLESIGIG
jgi:NADH:ubiquinone oxidoreductase subunit 2 (subunit N)